MLVSAGTVINVSLKSGNLYNILFDAEMTLITNPVLTNQVVKTSSSSSSYF